MIASQCLYWPQSTGVEFPEVTTLWEGDKLRSMGAGVRAKKFAFVPVKVRAPVLRLLLHMPTPDLVVCRQPSLVIGAYLLNKNSPQG